MNDVLKNDLLPETAYRAELTVYDNQGEEAEAELLFETALLGTGLMTADFIAPDFSYNPSCSVVFKKIELKGSPAKARAYVSALGMYTLDINGVRAGDIFFAPYWTDYRHTLEYQTYDITELLREGENLIEITLAKGWYRARLADYGRDLYGNVSAAIAELHIDGKVIVTDETWLARESVVLDSELYDGEIRDYTKDTSGVFHVKKINSDKTRLTGQINEPCRIIRRIKPVSEIITPKGERVIDFGQNLAGVVDLTVNGKRGQRVTIRHAEILDGSGNFYTENLRTAKAEDVFVLSGGSQILRAEFTYHGFRYIRIIGDDVTVESAEALVIHSDMRQIGFIGTSDERINRLAENIAWTQRSNFIDVPTDCPIRGVDCVRAEIETVYGRVQSCYEIDGEFMTVSVTIPVNTSAVITLPDGTVNEVGSGRYSYTLLVKGYNKTDKYTMDSKICDLMKDQKAAEIARKVAPKMFSPEQEKLLSSMSFSLRQLCGMSENGIAEVIEKMLKRINEELGICRTNKEGK